jgi:hypothetical protein
MSFQTLSTEFQYIQRCFFRSSQIPLETDMGRLQCTAMSPTPPIRPESEISYMQCPYRVRVI